MSQSFTFREPKDLDQMNLVQLTAYRAELETLRIKLQLHAGDVRLRFNKANNATNAAARLGGEKEAAEMRATPGVAVAKVLGRQLRDATTAKLEKAGIDPETVAEDVVDEKIAE